MIFQKKKKKKHTKKIRRAKKESRDRTLYKYQIIYTIKIKGLLFGATITTDSKPIFITCDWLNGSKTTSTHDDEYKTLDVENIDKITTGW